MHIRGERPPGRARPQRRSGTDGTLASRRRSTAHTRLAGSANGSAQPSSATELASAGEAGQHPRMVQSPRGGGSNTVDMIATNSNRRDGRAGVRRVHELAAIDQRRFRDTGPRNIMVSTTSTRRGSGSPRRCSASGHTGIFVLDEAGNQSAPFDFLLSGGNEGEGCNLSQSRAPANAWWRFAALAYFARRARRERRHLLKLKCTGQ